MTRFTFQALGYRFDNTYHGIERTNVEGSEYPATLHGLRKAFAEAKAMTFGGQLPGGPYQIAPRGRGLVHLIRDGEIVADEDMIEDEMDHRDWRTDKPRGKRLGLACLLERCAQSNPYRALVEAREASYAADRQDDDAA